MSQVRLGLKKGSKLNLSSAAKTALSKAIFNNTINKSMLRELQQLREEKKINGWPADFNHKRYLDEQFELNKLRSEKQLREAGQPANILQEAESVIYGDRQSDYGSVTENFTRIAKMWEQVLNHPVTPEQVGLCMCMIKIARQVNKPKRDNLVDLAGYAGTIEKLQKGE